METIEPSTETELSQVLATFPSTDVTITNFNYIIDLFLEYLLRKENNITQPEIILKWLIGWLESVSNIPWNISHRIFHVISTIITHCNHFLHLEDILQILDRITQLNDEIDVSNRADLLKLMVLTLSQEKLKKTFVETSDFSESNSVSSEISLNVSSMRKVPINVKKLPYYLTNTSYPGQNDAAVYLEYIEDVESKQPVLFKLQIESLPSNEHDMQALTIILAVAEGYGNFEPVLIGHFKVVEKQCTAFIHCHLQMPYPAVCNLRAEFTIRNRLMTCDLPSLQLTFSDFFRQLPCSDTQKSTMFEELWNLLLSKDAIKSFRLLELNSVDVNDKLNKTLNPFIVKRTDIDGDDTKPICFAIYLPPGKHLLFQFFIDKNYTKVIILTESTYILTCANTFLNDL